METDVEADEEMDVGEVEPEPEQLKTGGPGGDVPMDIRTWPVGRSGESG